MKAQVKGLKSFNGRKWEPIDVGEWMPIAWKVRLTCCQCGLRHTHQYRLRQGKLELKVTP